MNTEKKTRMDAWEAPLGDKQRWQVYERLRGEPWHKVAEWAAAEFGVREPSCNGMYKFRARMRKLEAAHKLDEAAAARAEITSLAEKAALPAKLVAGFSSLASEAALQGNARDAVALASAAMSIAAQQTAEATLALKARAQKTKDAQLSLAREKFEAAEKRLNAVREALGAAKSKGGLTAETLKQIEEAAGLL